MVFFVCAGFLDVLGMRRLENWRVRGFFWGGGEGKLYVRLVSCGGVLGIGNPIKSQIEFPVVAFNRLFKWKGDTYSSAW